jgi:ATP-dependent RNA helicase DDX54/DBP10
VKGTGEGADNQKIVKTESGTRLPATYKSGRFEEWQHKNKVSLPRAGEEELPQAKRFRGFVGGKKFRHTKITDAKPLDKSSYNYDRKVRQIRKREEQGGGESSETRRPPPRGNGKKSRYGSKPIGKVKSEIKSVDQIRKARQLVQRRKEKNARPSRKGKR